MVIGQIALHVMRKYYVITKIVFFFATYKCYTIKLSIVFSYLITKKT